MSWLRIADGKSGARELAVALVIFWVFVTGWLLFWIDKNDVAFYKELFGTITTAVFSFGLGAFGIASVMGKMAAPVSTPQRSRSLPAD